MSDSRESHSTVVIDKKWLGGVLPTTQLEMDRSLFLREGADIRGGVYGREMDVEGAVVVCGAVNLRKSLKVHSNSDRGVEFRGSVRAKNSILFEGAGGAVVSGDVYTTRLRADSTVFHGNLYCDECVLTDCAVRGFVFTKKLTMSRTSIVSFHAQDVRLGHGVSLWLPFALIDRDSQIDAPVRCGYLSSLETEHHDFVCDTHTSGTCDICVKIEPDELHSMGVDVYRSEQDSQSSVGAGVPISPRALSLTPRVLRLSPFHARGRSRTFSAIRMRTSQE